MFELILVIAAAVTFGRMAEADRGEGLKWGGITFALGMASLFIPLPFIRVILALGLAFALMTFSKKTFY